MKNMNCLCSEGEDFSNWDGTKYEHMKIIKYRLGLVSMNSFKC